MRIAHALQGMNLKTLQFVDPVIVSRRRKLLAYHF